MANQRLVNTNFWRDSYVINLDPTEKLLFLYFITNPATSLAGVYEIDLRLVALDTGIDSEMIAKILRRFCVDGKMYYERGWLVLLNFIKHQRSNPSIQKGIDKAIIELPTWLQEKVKKVEDPDMQITLELADSVQSGYSLGTESPQKKLKEAKIKEKKLKEANAPTAPDFSKINSDLAAKEKAARDRKGSDNVVRPTTDIIEKVRDRLKKQGVALR